MITLAINSRPIEVVPLESGEFIWTNIIIENAHQEIDGKYIGIREGLLREAEKNKVLFLNIQVKNPKMELSLSPADIRRNSKVISRPSKFKGFFRIYLYPI